MLTDWLQAIDGDGCALLPRVFSPAEAAELAVQLNTALAGAGESAMTPGRAGTVVAARNVLDHFPPAASVWHREPLESLLASVLGSTPGLVRALFFDKPPDRTWSLAWHKDLTIAVRSHAAPSSLFTKPTLKAGVPHVEAPRELLENMLTLRIHLDEVTPENGPLRVAPGSHRSGKQATADPAQPVTILAGAGDVLAMRPLLAHASAASAPGTWQHRRILHLEFAGQSQLADGYEWHQFLR